MDPMGMYVHADMESNVQTSDLRFSDCPYTKYKNHWPLIQFKVHSEYVDPYYTQKYMICKIHAMEVYKTLFILFGCRERIYPEGQYILRSAEVMKVYQHAFWVA